MDKHPTANYKIEQNNDGVLVHFFCDLSGSLVCTVKSASGQEKDVLSAWESKGRQHFSQCRRCGRWVSDPMYNAETLQCVQCSPWEEQPAFCSQCGEKVAEDAVFCHRCHARLKYRETEE